MQVRVVDVDWHINATAKFAYCIEGVFGHVGGRLCCLMALTGDCSGQACYEHVTDPRHLFGGAVDAEESEDPIPNARYPARNPVPQPPGQRLDALPQTRHQGGTSIDHLAHTTKHRRNNARNDLWDGGDNRANNLR